MYPLHNSAAANLPATEHEILHVEKGLTFHLPQVYRYVLKEMNGLSFTNGVLIYGTVELLERNETWEVAEYAKGYIAIGDDGGGMVFLMNRQGEDGHVFAVDCGDMNPQHATLITSDLNKWLQDGCQLETI
ncbi:MULTISPECIES: SMI1/KNR4 family protein [Lysinibacillus]|uniref:SMI1/KNR4 family protein n=2 Tax=Lysinibacillus TaxID=400634 RepID=A0A2I0UVG6_9BACI|nr:MULTISPECIES: SMI1/KNR4 family protein [Lysinibacillus]KUF34864.1 SMI1 / KNR4 family protein [Lysinibacillus sp. F5]PKU50023.1 SMI1/KNR4 family protein [Lysinibacillus fusiformis]